MCGDAPANQGITACRHTDCLTHLWSQVISTVDGGCGSGTAHLLLPPLFPVAAVQVASKLEGHTGTCTDT